MLTLVASQTELVRRAAVAPIVLAHLECFSNYGSGTVSENYHWTIGAGCRYVWGGSARSFDPVIARLSPIVAVMDHVPNGASVDTRRTVVELELDGTQRLGTGTTLWTELRGKNLAFARITIATLLVEAQRRSASEPYILQGGAPAQADRRRYFDFSDLAGTEHVVRFRGELTAVGAVTASAIPLTFEAREPDLNWPTCTIAADCDPRDLGRRYPLVVGKAKGVRAVKRVSGWFSALGAAITASFTGAVTVADASGFPTSNVTMQLGAERISARQTGVTQLTIAARGQAGTTATEHKLGDLVIEIVSSSVVVVNGAAADALAALYFRSPEDPDQLVPIDPSRYTVNLANTTVDTGRTLATATISSANLQAIYDDFIASGGPASVSTQPEFAIGGAAETLQLPFTSFTTVTNPFNPGGAGVIDDSDLTGIDGDSLWVTFRQTSGEVDGAHAWIGSAISGGRSVARFRLVLVLNTLGASFRDIAMNGSYRFYAIAGSLSHTVPTGQASVTGVTLKGSWHTPSGKVVSNVERSAAPGASGDDNYLSVYINNLGTDSAGDGFFGYRFADSYVEVELVPLPVNRTVNTAVTGGGAAGFAASLEYVADVNGPEVPGAGYKAASGALVEHPADAIKWFVETFGAGTVDASTDPSTLGSFKLAGDLRDLGESFGEILAGLSFASRLSIVPRPGASSVDYRLRGPDEVTYGFGASARTLADLLDLTESRKQALERATRFLALYDHRPYLGSRTIEAYQAVLRIGSDVNDLGTDLNTEIAAAELERGLRVAERLEFPLVGDLATIKKVMGYYAHEALRNAGRFGMKIPWNDGYDLELGDIVEQKPPWSSSLVKCRVTQIPFDASAASIGINLEEVE